MVLYRPQKSMQIPEKPRSPDCNIGTGSTGEYDKYRVDRELLRRRYRGDREEIRYKLGIC